MTLSSGVIHHSGPFDLAERRAMLQRRRRRVRRRELLGVVLLSGLALWLASAAVMALLAR